MGNFKDIIASDETSLTFKTMDPDQLMTTIIETSSLALLNWL